jgi:hypothetical protein
MATCRSYRPQAARPTSCGIIAETPSPRRRCSRPIHDHFVTAVQQFATRHDIPAVTFESGQDKDAIANRYRAGFTRREGVILLGIAQEKMRSFKTHKLAGPGKKVGFEFSRQWSPSTITTSMSTTGTGNRRFSARIFPIR